MDGNAKQQIVERVKGATNILVTVSRNPTVDELSAALALTFALNKLDKHATAVFSGQIPPAITFLEPRKTFESTVDSLRDFIIALNKEKADRLRYKVEDDVVRIFITPYKTTITNKDLQFSQGDFNVEVIIALGVEKREDLDAAITAHGRILHDAAIITINDSNRKNDLGSIDWQDVNTSSLSEMLMSLIEDLQKNIVDEQIATALLTGIVAATQRFSNTRTTPKAMTMAAQLMGAGANQQLIAARLEEAHEIPQQEKIEKDGSTSLAEGTSKKLSDEKKPENGEIKVEHQANDQSSEKPVEKKPEPTQPEVSPKKEEKEVAAPSGPSIEELEKDLKSSAPEREQSRNNRQNKQKPKPRGPVSSAQSNSWRDQEVAPPTLGGTLNATTEEAAEDNRRAEEDERNNIILSHDKPSLGTPVQQHAPINAYSPGAEEYEPPTVDPFSQPPKQEKNDAPKKKPLSIAELEAEAHAQAPDKEDKTKDVRADIEKALNEAPFSPANQPVESLGAQELPRRQETPEAKPEPAAIPAPVAISEPAPMATPSPTTPQPEALTLPPPPPLPDFSTLPPLPPLPVLPTNTTTPGTQAPALPTLPETLPSQNTPSASPAPVLPPAEPTLPTSAAPKKSDDPTEFKIPGA